MRADTEVIVIGAGGGGAVIAKELGETGLKVLVLEAGPWYGNKQWLNPNQERGGTSSSYSKDLDVILYKNLLNKLEGNMNNPVTGRFRWGPADRGRPPWFRSIPQGGIALQSSGVGGGTLHYEANCPRAFPSAIDDKWPISYRELIPYYEKVEATLPVHFAPITSKEELFYYGARKAGWSLNPTLDVTNPGYRPQPNAILPPNPNLMDPQYSLEHLSNMEGCTLAGHCINGCPHGPSMDKIAKRSANVSYVPLALKTGNVTIRPNTFTTKILTVKDPKEGLRVIGVQFRDTWTGETGELYADVVVMAAGCIETPRLWLNSGLPPNQWVGKGLTNHYFDRVEGIFEEKDLISILGSPDASPFVGQTSGARLDYPGIGHIQVAGLNPGLIALLNFSSSQLGFSNLFKPEQEDLWNINGNTSVSKLKELMADYRRMMGMLIITDDEVDWRNGVTLDPSIQDEHGPVPVVRYFPTNRTIERRNQLAKIAEDMLLKAGAKKIIRSYVSPGILIHIESTMRMGFVTDTTCEAYQVKRLYIADNSVHYNSLGGPNPTLTTQALATRTAEKLVQKYFS